VRGGGGGGGKELMSDRRGKKKRALRGSEGRCRGVPWASGEPEKVFEGEGGGSSKDALKRKCKRNSPPEEGEGKKRGGRKQNRFKAFRFEKEPPCWKFVGGKREKNELRLWRAM